ncbi:MAG TPA: hypothetical protein VD866_28475 [Urbifossiella sp.]|nr:hypothetical protein [Urbifossiella sp.]
MAKTGLSVAEHQRRTTENYRELRGKAPDLPWVAVLQGWSLTDYLQHDALYRNAGVDLAALPLVGVGSVCRRQGTTGVAVILRILAERGLRLHAFGLKKAGLIRSAGYVASADSLAWSYAARRRPGLPECAGTHARCNDCLRYALRWRRRLLAAIDHPDGGDVRVQPRLLPGTMVA